MPSNPIDRKLLVIRYFRIMTRFTIPEQNNLVAAIRSTYDCVVQTYSLALYERCLRQLTFEEHATLIEFVRGLPLPAKVS